ncbi:MAG: hypothetical protein PHP19_09160 [Firmicutes bacterium]|nr:hypothetical protein [Bacillota bacterium]
MKINMTLDLRTSVNKRKEGDHEKEWLQEEWMNYDFFGRNIDN